MRPGPEETRRAFIDAAGDVLRARGLEGFTTKAVARAAGRSEGSLYNHFADKVELCCEVVADELPPLIEVFKKLEPGHRTVEANLVAIVTAILPFYENTMPMRAAVLGDVELRTRMQAKLGADGPGPHRPHRSIAAYLADEQRLGRLSAGTDPQALAFLLLGACVEFALLDLQVGAKQVPITRKRFPRAIVRTLLAGHQPASPSKDPR